MTPVTSRNLLIERCSTYRGCEPCKRRKRVCNGKRPCGNCNEAQLDCVYSVVSDHARSVFTTTNARRLSSGSACETCRRRKTKCDGGNPCAFCASAGIECINNSERRKRSLSHNNINLTTNMATLSASSSSSSGATSGSDHGTDAIDRIEDRLRRIEKLMTAFTPSPLSQSTSFHTDGSTSDNARKLSSPQPPLPSSLGVRQHRHSVQGISVAKEQAALRSVMMAAKDTSTPPSSSSSSSCNNNLMSTSPSSTSSEKSSPPSSPVPRQSASSTQPITSSMLNLSLSPSSSTSSNGSSMLIRSSPSPPAETAWMTPKQKSNEWKATTPIPSLMDQLSKRTFTTAALDYPNMQYPIYPINQSSSPSPPLPMHPISNMANAMPPHH
ncbi:hypothetical protein RO3G_04343 [Lichtheimia corymbifera JMRC:FSU:9682]|uniref:Zn(2)-C6 fungal-type domain-containing protein n=1 Tax=Lichtheimia corymbifera JMRC:FSU:9682 TaxID=1263082 RepID=A0A068RPT8_9FUNG|nr:hypothetical protein RO3G_04343 [Lichtheimia corymbifera JMRC:FSU:9682]